MVNVVSLLLPQGDAGSGDWMSRGSCRGQNDDTHYPVPNSAQYKANLARAKRVCISCPVMDECLAWALSNDEMEGVWGGTSPRERAAMLRDAVRPRRRYRRSA